MSRYRGTLCTMDTATLHSTSHYNSTEQRNSPLHRPTSLLLPDLHLHLLRHSCRSVRLCPTRCRARGLTRTAILVPHHQPLLSFHSCRLLQPVCHTPPTCPSTPFNPLLLPSRSLCSPKQPNDVRQPKKPLPSHRPKTARQQSEREVSGISPTTHQSRAKGES